MPSSGVSLQEREEHTEESPAKGHHADQGLEIMTQEDRLRELTFVILEITMRGDLHYCLQLPDQNIERSYQTLLRGVQH